MLGLLNIVLTGFVAKKVDPIRLLLQQEVVVLVLTLPMLWSMPLRFPSFAQWWMYGVIIAAGVAVNAIGMIAQLHAQKTISPTVTSLMLSLGSPLILLIVSITHLEVLTPEKFYGSALIFGSVIFVILTQKS